MQAHLIDGTYELFRHHFGQPEEARSVPGTRGAMRGVLWTVFYDLEAGATHVGVATDHVIESFRNEMWPTYKSSAGIDPILLDQFTPLEEGLDAMGVHVWPMVELEADDALASGAAVLSDDDDVERVTILTPDKDLGQCVRGTRVVQYDRRKQAVIDEDGVRAKFGVGPESVADYLALVGDSADGFPGLPGWGAKSAAAVLARYHHIEAIPPLALHWDVQVRGATKLAATLVEQRDNALLFKDLATLRVDRSLLEAADDLRWTGPRRGFKELCDDLETPQLAERVQSLARQRG